MFIFTQENNKQPEKENACAVEQGCQTSPFQRYYYCAIILYDILTSVLESKCWSKCTTDISCQILHLVFASVFTNDLALLEI